MGSVYGAHAELCEYQERAGVTYVPVRLAPYESTFFVFEKTQQRPHAVSSALAWIEGVEDQRVTGWTDREGNHSVNLGRGEIRRARAQQVPALCISTSWRLVLNSPVFERLEIQLDDLVSWTDLPQARHFSGTGVYTTEFSLPERYVQKDIKLYLELGKVGNVADVFLNGKPVGTAWTRGQRLDVSGQAYAGLTISKSM